MSRAEANWELLVRVTLRGERLAGGYGHPVTGIAGVVPSLLVHIEEVLRAADEIQDEDPTSATAMREIQGELKKLVAAKTGLHPDDQKVLYKDKERDSKAFLDMAGVKDRSKLVVHCKFLTKKG